MLYTCFQTCVEALTNNKPLPLLTDWLLTQDIGLSGNLQ